MTDEIIKLYSNAGFETEIVPCYSLNCEYFEVDKGYPPFTAEKQIELIKWLIVHSSSTCLEDEIIVSAFEDSLANIINTLWQDLNEEERKQIKEILE